MTLPILLDELAEGVLIPKPVMDKAPLVGPVLQGYRAVSNARVCTKRKKAISRMES